MDEGFFSIRFLGCVYFYEDGVLNFGNFSGFVNVGLKWKIWCWSISWIECKVFFGDD